MDMRVDRNKVYEVAFKTIKESLEWADNYEGKGGYSNYIDGVISVADNFLDELDRKISVMDKCEPEDSCVR